jgi:uncharacterized OsmC-like protein
MADTISHSVVVSYVDQDKFNIHIPSIDKELFVDKGTDDHEPVGPNPLELFLSSLGSCLGVYAKLYLTRHDINFNELKIDVNAEFSTESPARLIDIKAKVFTDAELGGQEEVFARFVKQCPIHNTILHTDKVDIEVVS